MIGCCLPHQNAERDPAWYQRALDKLGPDSWYNHKCDQLGATDKRYTPMLFGMRDDAYMYEAMRLARVYRNRMWLIGNEPERLAEQGGSDTEPEEAADAVAKWMRLTDVKVALPGILWDEVGREWLEQYLDAGGPVGDFWAIHIYAHDTGHWLTLWQDWQAFLRERGLELPTLVTECAAWADDVSVQAGVMDMVRQTLRTDDMLQGAYWFAGHYGTFVPWWSRSDLLTEHGTLTDLGRHYVESTTAAGLEMKVYLPTIEKAGVG